MFDSGSMTVSDKRRVTGDELRNGTEHFLSLITHHFSPQNENAAKRKRRKTKTPPDTRRCRSAACAGEIFGRALSFSRRAGASGVTPHAAARVAVVAMTVRGCVVGVMRHLF
jgi:hypothetical protein